VKCRRRWPIAEYISDRVNAVVSVLERACYRVTLAIADAPLEHKARPQILECAMDLVERHLVAAGDDWICCLLHRGPPVVVVLAAGVPGLVLFNREKWD
jgi:hypothetical protein